MGPPRPRRWRRSSATARWRPSELAEHRADQAADRDPDCSRRSSGPACVDRVARPRATGAARSSAPAPRAAPCCGACAARKTAYLARRMRDLDPGDLAALERAAGVLERMLEQHPTRAPGAKRGRLDRALSRSFVSLRVPNYRRYFAGQLVSLSGNWMQTVAEIWVILTLTGSGVAVGVATALQFLPMLLLGALGGLIADRVPKRRLLIVDPGAAHGAPLAMLALAADRRGSHALDGVRAGLRARLRQRGRQPDPAGFVIEIVGARAGRQRGQPQQRPRPRGPRSSARRSPGVLIADCRRRALLRPQRPQLRRR